MLHPVETVTRWRPTGPEELALVEASGWRAWPPRLPDQPIFYPVLNEDHATRIARDWNVKASGVGYVTRFEVDQAELLCPDTTTWPTAPTHPSASSRSWRRTAPGPATSPVALTGPPVAL